MLIMVGIMKITKSQNCIFRCAIIGMTDIIIDNQQRCHVHLASSFSPSSRSRHIHYLYLYLYLNLYLYLHFHVFLPSFVFYLLRVLGVSVSLLGINNAESDSSSGGLDTVNISLQNINCIMKMERQGKSHLFMDKSLMQ